MKAGITIPCPICGKEKYLKPGEIGSKSGYCMAHRSSNPTWKAGNKRHMSVMNSSTWHKELSRELPAGPSHPRWKGGRAIVGNYIGTLIKGHPRSTAAGHYVYEHIAVAEKKIGRPLVNGELVHHLNGNKLDNRP